MWFVVIHLPTLTLCLGPVPHGLYQHKHDFVVVGQVRDEELEKNLKVLNYDFPPSAEDYACQIGCCGRIYQQGRAITFFDPTTNCGNKIRGIIEVRVFGFSK